VSELSTPEYRGGVLAELIRSGVVESLHAGHLVLLKSDGSIDCEIGTPSLPIFPRSAVKSLQASAMVRAGLKLSPEQLAVVCASHSGSEEHFRVIRSILNLHGLDESALRCALGTPLGREESAAWGSNAPTRLAMNCSGKHAGMIATSVINGWDIENYTDPAHPLQQAIQQEIETLATEKLGNIAADGCGAPLFSISTHGLARAIYSLTTSLDPVHLEVLNAVRSSPLLVAGSGRLDSRLMSAVPGLFMKEGAEGVQVLSMPDGRTAAFKFADGSARASGVLVHSILTRWGVDAPSERVDILGGGRVVGEIRSVL